MQRKLFILGSLGLMCFMLLCPMTASAQQIYLQFHGGSFEEMDETYDIYRGGVGFTYFTRHNGPGAGTYFHTVNFNKPDGHPNYIKSVSVRYYDSDASVNLTIRLVRRNIFTNAIHTVATWTSSGTPGWAIAHQPTIDGYKLVDTQKFVYILEAIWSGAGTGVYLYQVRVHYGF